MTADKLRDDVSTDSNRAVTTNHIRNNAVKLAKLDLFTDGNFAYNDPILSANSATPDVIASVSSVPPGTYLVNGSAFTTNASGFLAWFRTSGGTASVTAGPSSSTLSNRATAANVPLTIHAIVSVTSTTTIQLVGGGPSAAVFMLGRGITVIGIKS